MLPKDTTQEPFDDWLTVVAIAAIAISLTVAFHEGVHALTCLTIGGHLREYSALYESCEYTALDQDKIVAGSAPIFNLLAGSLLWIILRNLRGKTSEIQFFLWLFMLMNWFYGAGYLIFSGIANIGDYAVVISGWQPDWLWRVLMTIVGILLFMIFVKLGLQELGKMIGGQTEEQLNRANRLCILSYSTAFIVVLIAGFFCPFGLLSLPVVAGLSAVLGALSPFLWMMRWFRTDRFQKSEMAPLTIERKWQWIFIAVIVVFVYTFILGRTLYF
jgi:hypothetical protein